jgi:hypothetical protein
MEIVGQIFAVGENFPEIGAGVGGISKDGVGKDTRPRGIPEGGEVTLDVMAIMLTNKGRKGTKGDINTRISLEERGGGGGTKRDIKD